MIPTIVSVLSVVMQGAPVSSPEENRLIEGVITALRPHVAAPHEAIFRRIYLRSSIGMNGQQHTTLCGQFFDDDPRRPGQWTVFAGAEIRGEVAIMVGNRGLGNAADFCAPGMGDWDYERDFSDRFTRAICTALIRMPSAKASEHDSAAWLR